MQEGDIVEHGEAAEAAAGDSASTDDPSSDSRVLAGTLGIGSLKEER